MKNLLGGRWSPQRLPAGAVAAGAVTEWARRSVRLRAGRAARDARAMDMQAEYDNRAKVPEFQDILDGWRRDAAAFRSSHPVAELDVPYGPGARQALDVFWPDASRAAPIALFVHGGYWAMLDRSVFSHLAAGLLAHGVAVALPSYDLCPQVSLQTLVGQVRASAAFLARRHGRALLATGHSAGGHLAAMLLATDWPAHGLPRGTVRAALPISGLFDLLPLLQTTVNGPLGLDEATAHRLSPIHMPSPGLPIHAVVGSTEGLEYTRQSRAIAEAWGGTWEAAEGANHFTVVMPLADPDSALARKALAMLGP
jgi:arylformamidase